MGQKVGEVRQLIYGVVGCKTCATGIAIDMVGQIYGDAPYDWAGTSFGHECPLTRAGGVTPKQDEKLRAIRDGVTTGQQQAPLRGL
jgi:hypothetical protein